MSIHLETKINFLCMHAANQLCANSFYNNIKKRRKEKKKRRVISIPFLRRSFFSHILLVIKIRFIDKSIIFNYILKFSRQSFDRLISDFFKRIKCQLHIKKKIDINNMIRKNKVYKRFSVFVTDNINTVACILCVFILPAYDFVNAN